MKKGFTLLRESIVNSGQSLFEVMVAIGIAAIIITGIVSLATTSVSKTTFSRDRSTASRYSQEASEWLRGERDSDWSAFMSLVDDTPDSEDRCMNTLQITRTTECASDEFIPGTIYQREVFFDCNGGCSPTDDLVNYTVTVSWQDTEGEHRVRTSSKLTDWK